MVGNNILVTGGAGYIGGHTVLQLLRGGYNTVVIDNLDNSSLVSTQLVEELAGDHGKKFTFHQVDLRNKPALEKVFSESKFDAVIHVPGQKAVGECVAEPLLYFTNNLIGTTTLLEVMAAHGCKKLVVSSSAALSGSTEESPLSGMSFYGQTQLCIENICRGVQICDPEWRIIMLRYFNPVGAQSDYTTEDGLDARDDSHFVYLADGHINALQKLDDTEIGCKVYGLRIQNETTVFVDESEIASGMKIPQVSPSGSQPTFASVVMKSTPPPPNALRVSAPPPPLPRPPPPPRPAKIIDEKKQTEAAKALQQRILSYKTIQESIEDDLIEDDPTDLMPCKRVWNKTQQKPKKDNKDPKPPPSNEKLDWYNVNFTDGPVEFSTPSGQRMRNATSGQRRRNATASLSSSASLFSSASVSVSSSASVSMSSSASVSSEMENIIERIDIVLKFFKIFSDRRSKQIWKLPVDFVKKQDLLVKEIEACKAAARIANDLKREVEKGAEYGFGSPIFGVKSLTKSMENRYKDLISGSEWDCQREWDVLEPSQSQFQASGSSSPSLKINDPTETKESLKEGSDGSVTVATTPMTSSRLDDMLQQQLDAFFVTASKIDVLGPSQSQFQASGSSSPSLKINYPTETKESLKEGSDGSVTEAITPMASSQVDRKLKGKAVEEYSSTETTTITVSIVLADSKSGIPIEIPFRSNQTIRDIRNAIDERTPNSNRGYELQSADGVCRDLNKTVDKICIDGFAQLYQTFP